METLAEKIRTYANKAFIEPARRAGSTEARVTAGEVHKDLRLVSRMPAVCGALDARKFQNVYGVVLSRRSGPKQGSTAAWVFSIRK